MCITGHKLVKEGSHSLHNRFKIQCGGSLTSIKIFVYNFREEVATLLALSVTVTSLPARTLLQTGSQC